MVIGYATGVFDLFHVGHLNLLRNSRAMCDRLVVGVSMDELVRYKHKGVVIPLQERMEIVRAVQYVDVVIPQDTMDKYEAWKKLKFDLMFVGDDWYETDKWEKIEADLKREGVRIVYFPYTQGTTSTLINETLERLRTEG